jgi:radical SAM protein with 4Fe4S-binding SPASM domain
MRFSPADLLVFRKNIEIYREYIVIANVILTAPNIRKFMNNQVPHFDYLYENFQIFFDYYTPEKNFELMQPKDSELRDMFEFLVEHYPKAHPVCDFINSERNAMTCQSTYTIKQDGRAGRCTILLSDHQKESATHTAGEMEHKFISKMDCLSCEFFERCGLGCFLSNHFNGPSRTMNECWLKPVHRKAESVRNAAS